MTIQRLRSALLAEAGAMPANATRASLRGDWDVTAEAQPSLTGGLSAAAVLIAVSDEAEPQLLLTKRPETMLRHPGQIAFPGGRVDPGDIDDIDAALREAEEEVALQRRNVEVLGLLDTYETGTGFSIRPVVGIVPPGLILTPHAREVAEVFHVPFAHVIDPANHEVRTGTWQGRERRFYVIRSGNREIWGATAGIIVNLSRRLV
jgi:8-oxo-dGTP pyrophosphatase MutT (NUDIX family)